MFCTLVLVVNFQSRDDSAEVYACRHEKRHHSEYRKDTKAGQQQAKRAEWMTALHGDEDNPDNIRSQRVCQFSTAA